MPGSEPAVRIVGWDPRFARDVERLSREWIERWFVSKPVDEAYYADPAGRVITKGGEILLALIGDEVVGTCAAVPREDGAVELAKLAVTEQAKGRGIGRALAVRILAIAESRRAPFVYLYSSTKLRPALTLYESLGFVHAAMPAAAPHEDADVYMEWRPAG